MRATTKKPSLSDIKLSICMRKTVSHKDITCNQMRDYAENKLIATCATQQSSTLQILCKMRNTEYAFDTEYAISVVDI